MPLDEYDPRRARGGRPWRRIVAWVRANCGDTCTLCGERIDLTLPAPHPRSFSVDHIVPLALGGHPTDRSNLAPAHYGCNSAKGARMPIGDRVDRTSTDW